MESRNVVTVPKYVPEVELPADNADIAEDETLKEEGETKEAPDDVVGEEEVAMEISEPVMVPAFDMSQYQRLIDGFEPLQQSPATILQAMDEQVG